MATDFSRRRFLHCLAASTLASACASRPTIADADVAARLRELELTSGGRLGVCLLRADLSQSVQHRGGERFGMCSTFKLALAATVLRDSSLGRLSLEEFIRFSEEDMVAYAPVTTPQLAHGGMTIEALAEAAQVTSDNVAANLLLQKLGGPAGFTRRLREIGDETTRLDRYELELNFVPPGEVRDTTTPRAMAETVAGFFAGSTLTPPHAELLRGWMEATRTGLRRIRAGLPATWPAGDKTGTGIASGMANKYNDIAVVWPPGEVPVVITAYFDADGQYDEIRSQDEAVLAEVGRIAADWIRDNS